ncbi:PaaI family thioesterase [Streptomyces sp. NPDC001100]
MTRTTGGVRGVGEAGGAATPTGLWAGADFQEPPRTADGVALCGACRAAGSCRLGVEGERLDGDGVAVFELTCPRDQEGGPNVAHGGWTAAVLDDCLGHLPLLHRVLSVTAELSVSFVKPVPVERPLEVRAWVERREGRRWYIAGEMVLLPTRAVVARASGIWVSRDRGHFARHEEWLAAQEAKSDSAGNGNGEGQ